MSAKNQSGQASGQASGRTRNPTEAEIMRAILAALGAERDLYLMRNQVGGSERFDVDTNEVRHERYGLAKGSSDLVGILAPSGRWFCLEVKTQTGSLDEDQRKWLALARRFGAFACVVRSVDEAVAALYRARAGESE